MLAINSNYAIELYNARFRKKLYRKMRPRLNHLISRKYIGETCDKISLIPSGFCNETCDENLFIINLI